MPAVNIPQALMREAAPCDPRSRVPLSKFPPPEVLARAVGVEVGRPSTTRAASYTVAIPVPPGSSNIRDHVSDPAMTGTRQGCALPQQRSPTRETSRLLSDTRRCDPRPPPLPARRASDNG
jgi:hypothetical protein